ncbi:MAG TPA: protein tyrosine phosphatase [Aurantimonas coralicida]|uniref:Protein tyrosine phosphatase n=2 Tax=root TaxID=1 RepID=A0A9C9NKK4_9HYPH|nr:protein tyrosine phosphatase [Aurantimonas coralicida]HEU03010.1 protein tyrosine phosphatase [Aurantimonas coralicida]
MRNSRTLFRVLALAAAILVGPPAGYAGYLLATGNVHTVEPEILYRSGQLDDDDLEALIRQKGIRSVLNLRGVHPLEAWSREETLVAAEYGIDYYAVPISARSVPDMATMTRIARIMKDAPKPILVHCQGGADRSGLASAIFEYAVDGDTAEEAADQLSWRYGHFPWFGSRTAAMDDAFALFAAKWSSSELPAKAGQKARP